MALEPASGLGIGAAEFFSWNTVRTPQNRAGIRSNPTDLAAYGVCPLTKSR
ncbi:protein of unassigned function [Methylobacterium oryzae CBMB20]|uniref:Protein of unassigned function n=1 Tax=Methylobacterium oryzae CBMB20 TaxID=693986 RepID=A0A089NJK3_9HYPH|nr:protein of unassigned function [Methylobacterium oryzae CBMB20]